MTFDVEVIDLEIRGSDEPVENAREAAGYVTEAGEDEDDAGDCTDAEALDHDDQNDPDDHPREENPASTAQEEEQAAVAGCSVELVEQRVTLRTPSKVSANGKGASKGKKRVMKTKKQLDSAKRDISVFQWVYQQVPDDSGRRKGGGGGRNQRETAT